MMWHERGSALINSHQEKTSVLISDSLMTEERVITVPLNINRCRYRLHFPALHFSRLKIYLNLFYFVAMNFAPIHSLPTPTESSRASPLPWSRKPVSSVQLPSISKSMSWLPVEMADGASGVSQQNRSHKMVLS